MFIFINPQFDEKTKKQVKRFLNLMFLIVVIMFVALLFTLEY